MPKTDKIVLTEAEVLPSGDSTHYSQVIMARMGLLPRKKGATERMHTVLLELYESTKRALREKKPELAICTVEQLGFFAGITRQTMYEYLGRWIELNLITKASYIADGQVVVGYRLNGNTLEAAFEKAQVRIQNHMDQTLKYVRELQRLIKNEKIAASAKSAQ